LILSREKIPRKAEEALKKRIKKAILAIASVLFISGAMFTGCERGSTPVTETEFLLNTFAQITVYSEEDAEHINEAFALCRKYENMLSRTVPESDIYRLNARETDIVSEECAKLIELSLEMSEKTGGAFDITIEPLSALWNFSAEEPSVPDAALIEAALPHIGYEKVSVEGERIIFSDPETRIDLGASAKGFIADRLKEFLLERGVSSAIINLGGNIVLIGAQPGGEPFGIGVQDPAAETGQAAGVFYIEDCSAVTSGIYERCFEQDGEFYHHILDPETGQPIDSGLSSVTIVSPNSVTGDMLSTACLALGEERANELIAQYPEVYAIFISTDGALSFSAGAKEALGYKSE